MLGAALVLFLVGSNVQAGWLFVLAATILGVVAAGLVAPVAAVRGIEVTRRVASSSRAGDPVYVELRVHNAGRGERRAVEGSDDFCGLTPFLVERLPPGVAATLRYEVVPIRRGIYPGGPVELASASPFGISLARRRFQLGSPMIVHPRWVPLRSFPLLEAASTPNEPLHERRRRGAGLEFYGLRDYRSGDSLRHVHWPSTARGGRLLVREFEEQLASRLGIVIDAGERVGKEPATTFEDAVACAASLLVYALEAGHPVQLLCDSKEGLRHLLDPARIDALDWLAALEADGRRGLARVAEEAIGEIHRRSTNVLIFPGTRRNVEEAPRAVSILQERSARVIAVMLSAPSYDAASSSALRPEEEQRLIDQLEAARTIVYRVRMGEGLEHCLSEPPTH